MRFTKVFFSKGFKMEMTSHDCKLVIKKNVSFRDNAMIRIRKDANLEIGENVFFNSSVSINCRGSIVIGDNCMFGENVKLYDHNHVFRDKDVPIIKQGFSSGDITIGNNCWIGSNVVILKRARIGNNVVIGAGCIIGSTVPSNSIVKLNDSYTTTEF